MTLKKAVLLLLTFSLFHIVKGQNILEYSDSNTITTAVPFASIIANSQSVGTGLVGVVASDLNIQNGLDQNPALLSRGKKIMGFQLNYEPWLRKLVPDINLYEIGYYHSIGPNNAIGFSARYFDLGELNFYNSFGNLIESVEPWELMVALKYAHNFSDYFSMGVGMKYIHSDLTNNVNIGNVETHPGKSLALDLGFDYRRYLYQGEKYKLKWNAGLSVTNFGSKVTYSDEAGNGDFIPQALKIGTLFTSRWDLGNNNYIAWDLSYQVEKLLVPTPPIYGTDSTGQTYIADGMDPDVSVWKGAVQSFYDAPGGLKEELHEIIHQVGTEARVIFFDNKALTAVRFGYFNEHETKGSRKFFTLGIGVGYAGFRLDFSYLIPPDQKNPFENTIAVSLGAKFNLDGEEFFKFKEN